MDIKERAKKELDEEFYREKVERCKTQLRQKKHWFPWRIQIINLNEVYDNECRKD